MKCDVCGYEHNDRAVVRRYPDNVVRCRVCMERAAYGRYIPEREVSEMTEEGVGALNKKYDEWYRRLA